MMRSVTPMRTAKAGYIAMSVILMAAGAVLIAAPDTLASAMCSVLGVVSAVFGGVKIASYFSKDLFRLAFQHDLAEGILLMILGVTAAVKPELFLGFIGVIFGVCVLADGLLKIQTAIDAKVFGVSKWWLILAAAIAADIAGFFLIINPVDSAAVVAVILGVTLLMEGLLNLITVLVAVKIVKNQLPDDIITVNPVNTH
ncbi:MAG: DUF308 domain-containing protein [Ruminiclostridium sp.]|nr:DUF308 domain-containing protein [Ruminiclostridium sp.]